MERYMPVCESCGDIGEKHILKKESEKIIKLHKIWFPEHVTKIEII